MFSVPPGTILTDVAIPNLTGFGSADPSVYPNWPAFWPQLCDIYIPTGPINRGFVCLHGGGDTKHHFAFLLNILNAHGANWPVMNYGQAIFVLPQGQACSGALSPLNATVPFINSPPTSRYPLGITTWQNAFTNSGWGDIQGSTGVGGNYTTGFLADLNTYLRIGGGSGLNIPRLGLMGHSNGGFMVQRWWYQGADIWDYYFAQSGPQPNLLAAQPIGTANFHRPFWQQYGALDNVVGIANLGTTDQIDSALAPYYHFFEPTWQQPFSKLINEDLAYPSLSLHTGAWSTFTNMVTGVTGFPPDEGAFIASASPIAVGNLLTASYNSNKFVLRLLDQASHQLTQQTKFLGITSAVLPWLGFLAGLP